MVVIAEQLFDDVKFSFKLPSFAVLRAREGYPGNTMATYKPTIAICRVLAKELCEAKCPWSPELVQKMIGNNQDKSVNALKYAEKVVVAFDIYWPRRFCVNPIQGKTQELVYLLTEMYVIKMQGLLITEQLQDKMVLLLREILVP